MARLRILLLYTSFLAPCTAFLSLVNDLRSSPTKASFFPVQSSVDISDLVSKYVDIEDVDEEATDHRFGYVSIIGKPNVGKSTLMNELVGEKLSIITSKAQTTRHQITGVVTDEDSQIIYLDTPGVLKPCYMLHEGMMHFVKRALNDANLVLFIVDIFDDGIENAMVMQKLRDLNLPVVLALNKIDLLPALLDKIDEMREDEFNRYEVNVPFLTDLRPGATEAEALAHLEKRWLKILPNADVVFISAMDAHGYQKRQAKAKALANSKTNSNNNNNNSKGSKKAKKSDTKNSNINIDMDQNDGGGILPEDGGLSRLVCAIKSHLPLGEALLPDDTLTFQNEKFFASEAIREMIFKIYKKEVPYSCEVIINQFKERANGITYIQADIVVDEDSQRGIIIGEGGKKLKHLGIKARESIEKLLWTDDEEEEGEDEGGQTGESVAGGAKAIHGTNLSIKAKKNDKDASKAKNASKGNKKGKGGRGGGGSSDTDGKVFLDLHVRVNKHWRKNLQALKEYGYWDPI